MELTCWLAVVFDDNLVALQSPQYVLHAWVLARFDVQLVLELLRLARPIKLIGELGQHTLLPEARVGDIDVDDKLATLSRHVSTFIDTGGYKLTCAGRIDW